MNPRRNISEWTTVILGWALLSLCLNSTTWAQRVYFGSLHSHTGFSDGSRLPREAYTRARDVGGCDLFAVTEHNHAINIRPKDGPASQVIGRQPLNYRGRPNSLVSAAENATVPGRFIALYGQEFSTISSGNHVNVFDIPNVITVTPGRFDLLLSWLYDPSNFDSSVQPAILQFNPPSKRLRDRDIEYGTDAFASEADCLIEVISGPGLSPQDRSQARGEKSKAICG